ncbi:hypothetical protein [Pseudomonas putida]|uniref:hypothetical protein n=1 Tax=Pseudomonas putida TaxID=303 RepID=UPI0018FE5FF3|nr:hypothetical protein [Pseudomonas putida]
MTQDGLLISVPAIVDKLSSSVPIKDASSPTACSRANQSIVSPKPGGQQLFDCAIPKKKKPVEATAIYSKCTDHSNQPALPLFSASFSSLTAIVTHDGRLANG